MSRFTIVLSLICAEVISVAAVAVLAVQTTPVATTAAIVLYGSRSISRVFGVLSCCMVRCLAS